MRVDITREQFDKVMNDIVAAVKRFNDLDPFGDYVVDQIGGAIGICEDFIEEIFGVEDFVHDFAYWLATGTEFFIPSYTLNDKEVEIRTIDDLWNFFNLINSNHTEC